MSKKPAVQPTTDHDEAPVQPGEAEAAYESRKTHWATLGGAELPPPRANVAFVTSRVLQIASALHTEGTLAAFAALEKVPLPDGTRFDAACVRTLPVTASAVWHVRTRHLTATAQSTTVALPPRLVEQAMKLRDKSFKLVEYNCVEEGNPEDPVAADLASITAVDGPRYLDLATDLSRLAAYYRSKQWRPVLEQDKRRYDPKDGPAAEALASQILNALHQNPDASLWTVELYRGWADLVSTYDATRRGATFLWWSDVDARVPPLGALRPEPSRKPAAETPPSPPTTP